MRWLSRTRACALTVLLLAGSAACGGGVRPYRAMARAASSEENLVAQANDRHLKMQLREALLADGFVPGVTPYVYMGHVYLVGFVADEAHRTRAATAAGRIPGVQSVDTYLPIGASGGRGISRTAADLRVQGEVKTAIGIDRDERMTRIEVDVLAGHVVLLGVASSPEAIASVEATAERVSGVIGVTNFLLVPEAGSERLRPGLL